MKFRQSLGVGHKQLIIKSRSVCKDYGKTWNMRIPDSRFIRIVKKMESIENVWSYFHFTELGEKH